MAARRQAGAGPTMPSGLVEVGVLRNALPGWSLAIGGGLAWAAIMAISAASGVWLEGWQTDDRVGWLAALYAAGGFLAFPFGFFLAELFSRGRTDTGFAAALLAHATTTIAATAFLFAMHYRLYFAQWHDPAFTITWAFQFVFTGAAAVYQFVVLGIRLYFPLGFAALLALSLWHALRR